MCKFESKDTKFGAVIKVVGVGGAGCNSIANLMKYSEIKGVDYIMVDTDAQALARHDAPCKIHLKSPQKKSKITTYGGLMPEITMLSRAQGCIMGQFAGDSLGALVEFGKAEEIRRLCPNGLRELMGGGVHNIIAGQPTDDSEMAISLARTIIANKGYSPETTLTAYKEWGNSKPFDIGTTIAKALGIFSGRSHHDPDSQANGAMMRVSPLGIFGASYSEVQLDEWAAQDCKLTHIHPVCVQANQLYVCAIAYAIRTGADKRELYDYIADKSKRMEVDPSISRIIALAETEPPQDFITHKGWVLVAFKNALWQLLHADNAEEGIVDTVMRGGDTDTNACICGALLGAVYGIEAIPKQWTDAVINCRPDAGNAAVCYPRPEYYWPVDILELAAELLAIGEKK